MAVDRRRPGVIVAEGWNMERDGYCAKDCPRASCVGVVAGVSRYDSGPTRCIAIHAEEMVRRSLVGLGIRPKDVYLVVSDEPCHQCSKMLEKSGLSWQVLYL